MRIDNVDNLWQLFIFAVIYWSIDSCYILSGLVSTQHHWCQSNESVFRVHFGGKMWWNAHSWLISFKDCTWISGKVDITAHIWVNIITTLIIGFSILIWFLFCFLISTPIPISILILLGAPVLWVQTRFIFLWLHSLRLRHPFGSCQCTIPSKEWSLQFLQQLLGWLLHPERIQAQQVCFPAFLILFKYTSKLFLHILPFL